MEMIGKGVSSSLTDAQLCSLNQVLENHSFRPITCSLVRVYNKVSVDGIFIYSQENKMIKKRNSFTISFSSPHSIVRYGLVDKFVCIWL